MPDETIPLKANRAYPSLPQVGGDLASHTEVLKGVKEAVEQHERRRGDPLDSFVRLRELIDVGVLARLGDRVVAAEDTVFGGSVETEFVQDTIGGILTDTSEINFTYDDSTPSITAVLVASSVTFAKMQDIDALSVLGRAGATPGVIDEIVAGANDRLLTRVGDALAFTQLTAGMFPSALTLSTAFTLTGGVTIQDSDLTLWNTSAGADSKRWAFRVGATGTIEFFTQSDAGAGIQNLFSATRTGGTINTLSFTAPTFAVSTEFVILDGANVELDLRDSAGGTNQKYVGMHSSSGVWRVFSRLDNLTFVETLLAGTRNTSGEWTAFSITADTIALTGTTIDVNGTVDISGALTLGGNLEIAKVNPILILDDTDGSAAGLTSYVSFQGTNAEQGFVGFGGGGTTMHLFNGISGGELALLTTGSGLISLTGGLVYVASGFAKLGAVGVNSSAELTLYDGDAGANQRGFAFGIGSGLTGPYIGTRLDNGSFGEAAMRLTVNSSGQVTQTELLGDTVLLTGSTIVDMATPTARVTNADVSLHLRDSSGTASDMTAFISYRDSSSVERGWMGFGESNTLMRVRNAIGDIWVHAAGSVQAIGSTFRYSGGTEMRLFHDSMFISFYDTAGSARRGYIQATTGSTMYIHSEESTRFLHLVSNAGGILFNTSNLAGNDAMQIDSAGQVYVNDVTGSLLFRVQCDDSGPWAMGIQRSDLGVISQVFLHNPGAGAAWVFEHLPYYYDSGSYARFVTQRSTLNTPNLSPSEVGYKGIPKRVVASSGSTVATDAGKMLVATGASITITIDDTVHVDDTVLTFLGVGSGSTSTIISISGATLYLAGTAFATSGNRTLAYGGIATAYKLDGTTWIISGTGLT